MLGPAEALQLPRAFPLACILLGPTLLDFASLFDLLSELVIQIRAMFPTVRLDWGDFGHMITANSTLNVYTSSSMPCCPGAPQPQQETKQCPRDWHGMAAWAKTN